MEICIVYTVQYGGQTLYNSERIARNFKMHFPNEFLPRSHFALNSSIYLVFLVTLYNFMFRAVAVVNCIENGHAFNAFIYSVHVHEC